MDHEAAQPAAEPVDAPVVAAAAKPVRKCVVGGRVSESVHYH